MERIPINLTVNGQNYAIEADVRATLLDVLRENLRLTGSKKGCDHGQCGACTVHVNGQRALACLSLAATHTGDQIQTIEGLSEGRELDPVQEAFVECDAFQCGYCTPGQIMSAAALLKEAENRVPSHVTSDVNAAPALRDLSDAELRERMSGNICRCGAYPNIIAALRHVIDHNGEARNNI